MNDAKLEYLRQAGFFDIPRVMANPWQQKVLSEAAIKDYIVRASSNKQPVYTSHNSYLFYNNDRIDPYKVNIARLFFDFDSKDKPENAKIDAMKMLEWLDQNKLPYYVAFSGSKGFHVYILLKPVEHLFSEYLTNAYKAISKWLVKELDLRTLDMKCAEPKRICRVWYTPHVSAKGEINGLYCCPLYPFWVRDLKINQIMEYAKSPNVIDYKPTGIYLTLEEFVDKFKIDIDNLIKSESFSDINEIKIAKYTATDNDLKILFQAYPCLYNEFMSINPKHDARLATVTLLKNQGYSVQDIYKLFESRNFEDFYRDNGQTCLYQIRHAYGKYNWVHSCDKLQRVGICVGKECFRYKKLESRITTTSNSPKVVYKNWNELIHAPPLKSH